MNPEVIEAIKASIAHWRKMRKNIKCDQAPVTADCPLCALFYDRNCKGCPVAEKTGMAFCQGTPYKQAACIWDDVTSGRATIEEWRSAADEEIEFLKSLLPEKTKTTNQ